MWKQKSSGESRKAHQQTGTYTLLAFKQIAYSRNGCPRWQFIMADPNATTPITLVTASGVSSAYRARPHDADIGKLYQVQHHCTKGGKLVADAWRKVAASEVSDEREPEHLT